MPSPADKRERNLKENMQTRRILKTRKDKTTSLGRHKAELKRPRIQVKNNIDTSKPRPDFALYRRLSI